MNTYITLYLLGLYMPKRNLYLSDDDVELWDELPKGERGRILRDLLLERKSKEILSKSSENMVISQKEKNRNELLQQINSYTKDLQKYEKDLKEIEQKMSYHNMKKTQTQNAILDVKNRIKSLQFDYNENIGSLFLPELWDEIYSAAKNRVGEVFNHPAHKEKMWAFRIKTVKNGKIEIERLDKEEKYSSYITRNTTNQIEQKLEDNWHGDAQIQIKSGALLGDYGVECSIVKLSEKMKYKNESILYQVPFFAQYSKSLSKSSIEECISMMNREVEKIQNGGGGAGSARGAFYAALKDRFLALGFDSSSFISNEDGHTAMSFQNKIKLIDGKIIQIDD